MWSIFSYRGVGGTAVQYSTVQCDISQYSSVQYSAILYRTVLYTTVQYSAVDYSSTNQPPISFSGWLGGGLCLCLSSSALMTSFMCLCESRSVGLAACQPGVLAAEPCEPCTTPTAANGRAIARRPCLPMPTSSGHNSPTTTVPVQRTACTTSLSSGCLLLAIVSQNGYVDSRQRPITESPRFSSTCLEPG